MAHYSVACPICGVIVLDVRWSEVVAGRVRCPLCDSVVRRLDMDADARRREDPPTSR